MQTNRIHDQPVVSERMIHQILKFLHKLFVFFFALIKLVAGNILKKKPNNYPTQKWGTNKCSRKMVGNQTIEMLVNGI